MIDYLAGIASRQWAAHEHVINALLYAIILAVLLVPAYATWLMLATHIFAGMAGVHLYAAYLKWQHQRDIR